MKAWLVTYNLQTQCLQERRLVEVADDHNFADGPYVDTVPFSVGSNQTVVPEDWYQSGPCEFKRYSLLWMYNRENRTMAEVTAASKALAVIHLARESGLPLDLDGYLKQDDGVSYCVAEGLVGYSHRCDQGDECPVGKLCKNKVFFNNQAG